MSLERNKIISNFKDRLSSIRHLSCSMNEYRSSGAYAERLSEAKYINHWNPTSDFWVDVDFIRSQNVAYIKSGKVSKKFTNILGGGGYLFKNLTLESIISSEFLFEWDFLNKIRSINVNCAESFGLHPLQMASDISSLLEVERFDNIFDSFKSEIDLKMFLAVFWQQISFDWRPIFNQRQYFARDGYEQVDNVDTVFVGNRVNPMVFSVLLQSSLSDKRSRVFYSNNKSRMSEVFSADYGVNIVSVGSSATNYIATASQSVAFPMINFPSEIYVNNLSRTRLIIDDPNCELSVDHVRKLISKDNVVYILMSNILAYKILASGEFGACEMFLSDTVSADNINNYNYLVVRNVS